MTDIDYRAVNVPQDESLEGAHYSVRRAYILERILEKGTPARVNRTELASQFSVSVSQISRDIDVLGEYVRDADRGRTALQTTRGLRESHCRATGGG